MQRDTNVTSQWYGGKIVIIMTTITNAEPVSVTTMEQVQSWMTSNSISTTSSISLEIDQMGYVKEFTTDETLTTAQITDFEQEFFNKRSQGNQGGNVTSADTITLTEGNLITITGTTSITYITTTDWKVGSMICLEFESGTISIIHGGSSAPTNTAAIYLSGSGDAAFGAASTLTLIYDGTYWKEIARMSS